MMSAWLLLRAALRSALKAPLTSARPRVELAKVAAKYGLEAYGAEGDPFDPHIHEALMHLDKPGYPVMSVAQVFQRGYRLGDRIVRPARVGVADADPAVTPEAHVGSDE